MKAEPCFMCGRSPFMQSFPASADGSRVALILQCSAHLNAQVSMYGENYTAIHRALTVAWNEYQAEMKAQRERAA